MREEEFRKILVILFVVALAVLAFLILRPIIIAVLSGLILAYLFTPLYNKLRRKIKSKNACALIIVAGIFLILLLLAVFLIPVAAKQIINIYVKLQGTDLASLLQKNLPDMLGSVMRSADIAAALSSLTSNLASYALVVFQKLVFNLPSILLQIVIVLFTFFFVLRDFDDLKDYFLSVSPFSKDTQSKFYEQFEQVTNSILYGQLIVGVLQGVIAGVGYFIFRIPNALLFTLLTVIVGILPVIGPWLVWIPIDVWLFVTGRTGAGIGLLIYGLLILSWIDSLVRPLIVSRMTKMNTAIALIGMVGGLFFFGIIGLIIGPLVLAYLFLVAEFYKEKRVKSILIEEKELPRPVLPNFPSVHD